MGFLLKHTLSVLQSQRSGFGISCGIGLSALQSQAFFFANACFGETVFGIIFPLWTCLFSSENGPAPQIRTGNTKAKKPYVKNKTLQENPPAISIYIYAVKLLSGPSLAILGVIIWAK